MQRGITKTVYRSFFAAVFTLSAAGSMIAPAAHAAETRAITLPFHYAYSRDGVTEEAGSMSRSTSPYFWLNSGGYLYLKDGTGKSVHGPLPKDDTWRLRFAAGNAYDTDGGYYPQNLFRLYTRTKWQDVTQEAQYKINKYNLSKSTNRAEFNGLLLMSRLVDGNNLYYAGLRVDGNAVIKKKIGGKYYTMAMKPVITTSKYDRTTNPNLLPEGTWIGLRTVVKNISSTALRVSLYADIGNTGTWKLVAEAVDDGKVYGGKAFTSAGYGGMRTDFMDVEFDNYRLKPAP